MINLAQKIFKSPKFNEISQHNGANLFITGTNGSLRSLILSYISGNVNKKIIYCSNDTSSLFKIKDDLNFVLGSEVASIYLGEYDEEYESDITPLSSTLKKLSIEDNFILLSNPNALNKSIISEDTFKKNIILLKKNQEYSFEGLITKLNEFNFKKKNIVEEENDFAVRGGIIDIFPENLNQPVRIEFFGNTIESIREFDAATQRSISQLNEIDILPSVEEMNTHLMESERLIDYARKDTLIIIDEPDIIKTENKELFNKLVTYSSSYFSIFNHAKSESAAEIPGLKELFFVSKSQPSFNSNIKLLFENLKELTTNSYEIFIACADDYQAKRFKELIDDLDEQDKQKEQLSKIVYLDNSFHEGFVLPEDKIAVYTEHELFDRYYRPAKRRKKFGGITFKELSKINFGDFMVHQNYGIGKYAGLRKIKTGDVEQEAVKLLYENNDAVFVNLNSLNLVKKFSAQEGVTPKLNKLGGNEWEKIKQRTKKKIQDIARDLILLYSKRKEQKGFKFSQDSVWQKELEASFIYEDTPDQISATEAVKKDMESDSPMDRLICGDVGFGKTEIAIRAAFKAVMDGKQAAVLVPTTILAEQHYNTFRDRLSHWAVDVEHLSRFKSKKEAKEVLEKLEQGKLNIIIGTHRLLSKDVTFKDLGLLVIDEEQRFGVKAKEKLKFMRENVDVLTLTATPIPRTLNFSLLGARDLSIINTPPKNRQPIHTEIINFDKKIIGNAITRELQRNGQVYFVNDRIAKLEELGNAIEEMVPFAKVAIAHGQMTSGQLENVMMRFLEKKCNVLLCTKIIESGLDIPSVNTIIINRADNFGLAELYQLRGRVGRSNLKSFAYLVTPPQSILTKQAIRRLHALEEFSELGSGINLALKDMEIRGAGNLLGKEQSGFIGEIGFDMYMQILDEAMTEIKESELGVVISDIAKDHQTQKPKPKPLKETVIESDVSMLLPEDYIEDENTRLEIYQRLSRTMEINELNLIKEEVIDRFGKLPEEVEALFIQVKIKILASEKGFDKLVISGSRAELFFDLTNNEIFVPQDGQALGYFQQVVDYINTKFPNTSRLNQSKTALSVTFKLTRQDHSIEKLEEVREIVFNIIQPKTLATNYTN